MSVNQFQGCSQDSLSVIQHEKFDQPPRKSFKSSFPTLCILIKLLKYIFCKFTYKNVISKLSSQSQEYNFCLKRSDLRI